MLRFTILLAPLLFLLHPGPHAAGGRARAAAASSARVKSADGSAKASSSASASTTASASTLLQGQAGVGGRPAGLAARRRWEQKLERQFNAAASGDMVQATFSGGNVDAKVASLGGQHAAAGSSVSAARRGWPTDATPLGSNIRRKDRTMSPGLRS